MDVLIPLAAGLLLTAGIIVAGLLVSGVLSRPPRRTTDELTFRHIPMPGKVDWKLVRTMELDLEGRAYHDLQGNLLDEPLTRADLADEVVAAEMASPAVLHHLCKFCDQRATWQSKVDNAWLCGTCHPCWCGYCNGRVNVHGAAASSLYAAQIDDIKRVRERRDEAIKRHRALGQEGERRRAAELAEMDQESRSYADSLRADMARSFGYVRGSIEP